MLIIDVTTKAPAVTQNPNSIIAPTIVPQANPTSRSRVAGSENTIHLFGFIIFDLRSARRAVR